MNGVPMQEVLDLEKGRNRGSFEGFISSTGRSNKDKKP